MFVAFLYSLSIIYCILVILQSEAMAYLVVFFLVLVYLVLCIEAVPCDITIRTPDQLDLFEVHGQKVTSLQR